MKGKKTLDLDAEIKRYRMRAHASKECYSRACQVLPGGVSHQIRAYPPFPVLVTSSDGPRFWDMDGNSYLDYWMGHYALIMGHQPEVVVRQLQAQLDRGIMWGSIHPQEVELAEKLCRFVPSAEKVRFCTTGTEATMFAIRLARGYTGKSLVFKMEGGWHGPSSELLHGVTGQFERSESLGMPDASTDLIQALPFNDLEATAAILSQPGLKDRLAAIIVEPMLGSSWFIPARPEYLQLLRDACSRLEAVLIFDEIITGFRVSLGGAQQYYNITPDLTTMGKILGAGLPLSAVCGKKDIMDRCNPHTAQPKWERVRIGGGTFSCHPLAMAASLALIDYLSDRGEAVYAELEAKGQRFKSMLADIFAHRHIRVALTGIGSLFILHFLDGLDRAPINPREVLNACHYSFKEKILKLLLLNRGIYVMHGGGAISLAHSDQDLDNTAAVFSEIADLIDSELLSTSRLDLD
ncbi:aspartate aminotransferase family protein [bacterium]|nr:aspartate aminotransferase family protein [bacterium]